MNKIPYLLQTLLLSLIIISHSSCSLFLRTSENEESPVRIKNFNKHKLSCAPEHQGDSFAFAKGNKNIDITNIFQNISKKHSLNFIETAVLWSLIQMNIAPHAASPSAKLQVFIKFQGQDHYFEGLLKNDKKIDKKYDQKSGQEINTKMSEKDKQENSTKIDEKNKQEMSTKIDEKDKQKNDEESNLFFPYLVTLESLLKKFNSKKTLYDLSLILEKSLPKLIPIDENFSNFIKSNQGHLYSFTIFRNLFFKGNEPLRKDETIPRLPFTKMVKIYDRLKKKNSYLIHNYLFPFITKEIGIKNNITCNFDMGLYQHDIYLISKENSRNIQPFAYNDNNGNSFLAVSNRTDSGHTPLLETPFIISQEKNIPLSLCSLKNEITDFQTVLLSARGRDPGQHLHNLIEKKIMNTTSIKDLRNILQSARHVSLFYPKRKIIESHKISEKELAFLQNSPYPFYHQHNLGLIWSSSKFKKDQNYTILLDSREVGNLKCL